MRSKRCMYAVVFLLCGIPSFVYAQPGAASPVNIHAPSYFEENRGQIPSAHGTNVLFVLRDKNVTLYFSPQGIQYAWHTESPALPLLTAPVDEATGQQADANVTNDATLPVFHQRHVTTMQWAHASAQVEVMGEEPAGSYSNYYLPHCPQGVLGVRHFRRLVYRNIYPHTDIVYYIKDGHLKYDIVLRPGATLQTIEAAYAGIASLQIDSGKVKISTPLGFLEEGMPVAWNDQGPVPVAYRKTGSHTFSFDVPAAGRHTPVASKTVIDPSVLWGTYLGGGGQDYGYAIDTDAGGNIFIGGHTESSGNIAFGVAHQPTRGGNADAFLSKYTSAGALVWSTYFGGAQDDVGRSIAIDGSGSVAFGGHTASTAGFIPAGGYQPTYGGGVNDGFLAYFTTAGVLQWATYWGGTGDDVIRSVETDGTNFYFGGHTSSTSGVATTGTYGGGLYDVILGKVSAVGLPLWSTYVGGAGEDQSWGIGLNGTNILVSGYTNSAAGIASAGAYQTAFAGGSYDAFLIRINGNSGAYIDGTYYGGPGSETCRGFAIDGNGDMYLSGFTTSATGISFGTAHQATYGGGLNDIFLAKFNTFASLEWATYLGGPGDDNGRGIATDPANNILITGNTASTTGIAYAGALQTTYGGGAFDGFLAKFQPNGFLLWSTYYGGAGSDYLLRPVCDNLGNTTIVGQTTSTTGVVSGGQQTTIGGGWDALLVRMESFEESILYSRQDGDWESNSTWSNVSHTGPPTTLGGTTGTDYFIGNGHTVSLSAAGSGYVGINMGLKIDVGAALQGNHFGFFPWGDLIVEGDFLNASIEGGVYELYSTHPFLIFDSLNYGVGNYAGTISNLHTDVVVLEGMRSIDGATLNYNGQDVCLAYMAAPSAVSVTLPSPTGLTLTWSAGAGDAFIVARESTTPTGLPQFGTSYTPNALFGSGAQVSPGVYAVYQGSATSVAITGLQPETDYVFEFYSYNTLVGGCYSITTVATLAHTTCAVVPNATNPVAASFCTGSALLPVRVDNPGAGHTIFWYADATGTIPATGTPSGTAGEIFTPAAAGTVYARNFNTVSGCYSGATVAAVLTELPPLVSGTASINQNVCLGGDPAVITGGTATGGNGTYTYQWQQSLAAGGPFSDILSATAATYDPPAGLLGTTYYQRIAYSGGCTQPSTVIEIAAVPLPVLVTDPQPDETCDGLAATFQISATGVALTYQWQADVGSGFADVSNGALYSGATTQQLQISDATGLNNARYRCVVMSAGVCSLPSGAAVLTVSPVPSATDQPQSICETAAGTGAVTVDLTALANGVTGGAANTTVSWWLDPFHTNPVPAPATAPATNGTTFFALVSNLSGTCTNSATAAITVLGKPAGSPTVPHSICGGTSTNLTFAPTLPATTFTWTVAPNANITGAVAGSGAGIDQTLNNLSQTRQVVVYTVTPATNDCTGAPFLQEVEVDPIPTAYDVTGGGSYCAGPGAPGVAIGLGNTQVAVTYTLLRGGAPTGVTASPGGGAFNFPNQTVAGDYTVRAATALNCANLMNGSATVTILNTPAGGSINASKPSAEICTGENITFTTAGIANDPTDYDWTLPAGVREVSRTDVSITVTGLSGSSGNVTVVPSNTCGDGALLTLAVSVQAAPDIEIVLPASAYAAEPLAFNHTTQAVLTDWSWTFGDGQASADPAPEITYAAGGTYAITLEVIAQNGCTNADSKTLVVLPEASLGDLAIKNVVTANGDGANDLLYIERIDMYPDNEVILLDRWGAEVFRRKNYLNDWDLKKNDQYIPAGNYVCVVRYSGKVFSRTVTVLKNK